MYMHNLNFNELVLRKKKEFGNLIDDETAFLLVLKDLGIRYPPKIIDLFSNLPVTELNVKVIKKIKDNGLKIYEVCDESAKARLITKKNIEEGNFVKVQNPKIARNKYITIFSNKFAPGGSFDLREEVYYVGEYIAKVISDNELLTDSFYLVRCKHGLDIGKYYHIKILHSNPVSILFARELSLDV